MNKFAKKPWLFPSILLIGVLAISSAFNKNQKTIWGQNLLDSLTDSQKRETQNSLKGLKLHPDLEITTFATEPMLQNPTNIDIDSKGRI